MLAAALRLSGIQMCCPVLQLGLEARDICRCCHKHTRLCAAAVGSILAAAAVASTCGGYACSGCGCLMCTCLSCRNRLATGQHAALAG